MMADWRAKKIQEIDWSRIRWNAISFGAKFKLNGLDCEIQRHCSAGIF